MNGLSAECQSGMCYNNCIHGMEALQRDREKREHKHFLSRCLINNIWDNVLYVKKKKEKAHIDFINHTKQMP